MPESFVIPLRVPGLVKADFAMRLYLDGARQSGSEAAITVVEVGGTGDYRVSNLPDAGTGEWWTLTWEFPAGAGFSYAWTRAGGTPTSVVIPMRTSGLTAPDFALRLYLDGELQSDILTVEESNVGLGDYRVSGWPVAASGERWVLSWSIDGLDYSTSWIGDSAGASGTFYLEILAVQRPFPIGNDENDRPMFSCNFDAVARAPVEKWEEEIGRLIFDAGLGEFGTSMLLGGRTPVSGPGPWINLIDTGGLSPLETHNNDKQERLSIQIIVRASVYQTARTRALAIWRLLDGKRDVNVTAA